MGGGGVGVDSEVRVGGSNVALPPGPASASIAPAAMAIGATGSAIGATGSAQRRFVPVGRRTPGHRTTRHGPARHGPARH